MLAGARAAWLSLRERPEVWAELDGRPVNVYAARGWLPRSWERQAGEGFTLEAPGPLEAAVDGEPAVLEPPLDLTIEPGALRVLLPPG